MTTDAGPTTADGPAQAGTVTYRGTLDATTPVAFGGTSTEGNFCNYTITLKQLELDLSILPSKQILSGQLQAQQVEATDANCTFPPIAPNLASYQLSSAVPSGDSTMLTFQAGAANMPHCSLVGTLTPTSGGYTAQLTFHRIDISTVALSWTVTTQVAMSSP